MDQLIFTIIQLYHFDFRAISKHDVDLACQQYLLSLINRVISFDLSDDDETSSLPEIFLSYGYHTDHFIHLKSLSIDCICHSHNFKEILSKCRELPYLTQLSIHIDIRHDRVIL